MKADYNAISTGTVMVPDGQHYYYKVRISITSGSETVYSAYSNVLDIDNT